LLKAVRWWEDGFMSKTRVQRMLYTKELTPMEGKAAAQI
jgi:hypothetical protein